VEVPVATREQTLEMRDAGHRDTIDGVDTACRGCSIGKVWIAIDVAYAVLNLVIVTFSVWTDKMVEVPSVVVVVLVTPGGL
jgi:hypothetical protein